MGWVLVKHMVWWRITMASTILIGTNSVLCMTHPGVPQITRALRPLMVRPRSPPTPIACSASVPVHTERLLAGSLARSCTTSASSTSAICPLYHRERVRGWVKSKLDKEGAESKGESLAEHLHFTNYKIGKQVYHQIHLSHITAKDVADVHGALNSTLYGTHAGNNRSAFVVSNAQRTLAVEARIGEWDKVYKGSQACPKCLQMGHVGEDCVGVHLCDNCYHTAPEGCCANPDGCQRFGNGANGRRYDVMRKQQRQQAVIIAMNQTGVPSLLSADRVVAQIDSNLPTAISGREQPRTATASKSSRAIAEQQLKKRCSRLAAASTQTEKELDAVIATLGLPGADAQLTKRQRSKLIAYITDSKNAHGVRVALASEYNMEQLVTGGGYAQSNNMLLQNQMHLQHAMMARQSSPQIQLTPGLSGGMGGMNFQTPTQGNAQRALMDGRGTGFSFPGQKG